MKPEKRIRTAQLYCVLLNFFDVTTDYLLGRSNYNLNNTKKLISALHEIALDLDDICNQLKQE